MEPAPSEEGALFCRKIWRGLISETEELEAKAQYERIATEMQSRDQVGSLLPYEKSTMQAQLNAVAEKAWPSEKPPSAPSTSWPGALASVKVLHPEGDFQVREEEGIPTAEPTFITKPLSLPQIMRLLGVSPWQIEYGAALRRLKIPK